MTSSVRQRIVDQVVENLSNVVAESYIVPQTGNSTYPTITSSGTYSGTTPVKYELEVTDTNEITYTDITNSGTPTPVSITSGVAFAIGSTGISCTFTYTSLTVGDKYTLRMNKSAYTLKKVLPWYAWSERIPMPHVLVHDVAENKEPITIERYDCTLELNLILRYKEVKRETNEINDLVADIENEFNRDINLTDSSGNCLSIDLHVIRSEIGITEGSQEIVGALIECLVFYRHAFDDTRTIKN